MTQQGLQEYQRKFYAEFPHVTTLEHGQSYEPIIQSAELWWAEQIPTQTITAQEWKQWRPNLIFKQK